MKLDTLLNNNTDHHHFKFNYIKGVIEDLKYIQKGPTYLSNEENKFVEYNAIFPSHMLYFYEKIRLLEKEIKKLKENKV